jgi:ATP-dependent Clp protease protease subunit
MQNDMYDMIPSNEKINSKLLSKHIYFLNGDIDSYSVEEAIKWILYENTEGESDKVLSMYINSLGGSLTDALALVDIMRQSRFPIKTIGIGSIVSAGFMIFACGTKGM